ncbi:MAG: type II/IV secretion system protein [Candidatus Moranbacteria bacterium]|nr:type II/IV secretion system protein [Candidatus Moranbacteria bacterium]MDD3964601.1 type II/IV secretion system protein [Candidatus Moranbacteria bacterium]
MTTVIQGNSSSHSDEKDIQSEKILQKMREVSIEEQASLLANKSGLAYIDLHVFPVSTEDVLLVPEEEAKKYRFVLFNKKNIQAYFAILNPNERETLQYIKDLCTSHGWKGQVFIASQPSLDRAWNSYTKRTFIDTFNLVRVSLDDADLEKFEKDFGDLISLKENVTANTSRSMEIILAGARKLGASDIHLEPAEDAVRLRYRIDGVLQEIGNIPSERYHLILSRIKMLGKMRLNVRKEAQDGHFFITLEEKRIDVRVNSIPGKYGENINMRLLSGEDVVVDVTLLGFRGLAYEEITKQITKPNGLILNTGPTGSGKTTTLYTLLNHINQPDTKVITIEDPIEYTLPGVVQTEVSKNKEYTFATALRAIVRQDPDIILVGEIRDDETADITINAALTGHLVFSTLHSNSAAASIPRFMELGVKPSLLASAVNAIIAQRLVRVLCEHCKEAYVPAQETIDSILKLITIISPKAKLSLPKEVKTLYKSVGCAKCHLTGYHGRVGIFEVLTMTQEIIQAVNDMGTEQEILRVALENGMITMTQDGILKALDGITTLDEVWRVADQTESLRAIYTELMPSELSRSTHISEQIFVETKQYISSLENFSRYLSTLDSRLFFPSLFAGALFFHAGDIHIEPVGEFVDIRFRIDGILQTAARIPLSEYPTFVAEIKLAAGLKSGERSGTVDGRFSLTLEKEGGKKETIDIRLSIILGGFGETIVMRILNQSMVKLDLDTLHIRKQNLDTIHKAMNKSHGVILSTGPTGSGKTTTLYSILAKLNTPEVKIITVEDPIEYQMPGILQTQTKESEGYTFATALRSLMRQNPNILMVGEIRDDETAQIAVQAASTGHLVLSTLHANSASGAVSRLSAMGVSNDDIANTGNLFIAQRLVRRICQKCKESSVGTEEEQRIIRETLASLPASEEKETLLKNTVLPKTKGCESCGGTGFLGQIVIAETLFIEKEISELIARGALTSEIEEKAISLGMITLAQDGILSVLEGKTTLEEVQRVTDI